LITMIKPYTHIKGGEIICFLPTTTPVYMQFKRRLKAPKKGLNPFNHLIKRR
jgi:hypothetical protein